MSYVRSMNRVILIGNVGRTPETSVIASSGRDVAKFSLATKEGYYDANKNWKDSTEWHNIVAFGPIAKKVERSVNKGDLVLVEGRIKSRRWNDKNSGQERTAYEINADTIVVLNKMNRNGQQIASGDFPSKPTRSPNEDAFAGSGDPANNPNPPFADPADSDGLSYGEGDTEDPF